MMLESTSVLIADLLCYYNESNSKLREISSAETPEIMFA